MVDAQAEIVGDIDILSLRVLAAVAETGSIAAAGRVAGLTQQAASVRMRQLERRIGVPLLQRRARGSTLTPAGAVAAEWAADVVEAAERFSAGVAALRGRHGPLAVAASLTVAEYLLPGWLLAGRSPEASSISVTATNSDHVLDLVAAGSHPLGFIESPQDAGALTAVPVARDELVVVVPPTHPWARRASIPRSQVARTPLVTRERGSGTRLSLEQILEANGDAPAEPLLELPTTAAVRTAVASGAGPAVLSILAVRDDIAAGRLARVRVRDQRFIRELRAVYADADVLAPELRALLDAARRGGMP